jgi:hypothetical protein
MSSDIDLLALHFVGGRIAPEESRARPMREYGDPARYVKFEGEKCGSCVYSRPGKAGQFCSKGKKHGTKCREYKGKK